VIRDATCAPTTRSSPQLGEANSRRVDSHAGSGVRSLAVAREHRTDGEPGRATPVVALTAPHVKSNKSAYVAERQLEAGAVGLAFAKLSEAKQVVPAT